MSDEHDEALRFATALEPLLRALEESNAIAHQQTMLWRQLLAELIAMRQECRRVAEFLMALEARDA